MAYPTALIDIYKLDIEAKQLVFFSKSTELPKAGYLVDSTFDFNLTFGNMLYECVSNINSFDTDKQNILELLISKYRML